MLCYDWIVVCVARLR